MASRKREPMHKKALEGFVLSLVIPPVGYFVSLTALRKLRGSQLRGKGLALAGVIVGAVFSILLMLLLIALLVSLFAFGGWSSNDAEEEFKPIASKIEALGGKKICDNGDSGRGFDNTTPWYEVYYIMPATADLLGNIKSLAEHNGFELSANTDFVNRLKGIPGQDGDYVHPYGDEEFNPKADYLKGQNSGTLLTVTIHRQTEVALYCGVDEYGKKQRTGNDAILDIHLTLPDTQ